MPGAHVARLLLAPHDLSLLETPKLHHQRLGWERIKLFDAQDVDVVDAALLALLVDIVIDLARAQYDAADLVVGLKLVFSSGNSCASSHNTRWNEVPAAISSSRDTARLWRSSDFGVIRINGFLISRLSWRRSA